MPDLTPELSLDGFASKTRGRENRAESRASHLREALRPLPSRVGPGFQTRVPLGFGRTRKCQMHAASCASLVLTNPSVRIGFKVK